MLLCLALGGALGLAMRAEMVRPEADLMAAATYNRMFTLHGAVLLLGFALPAILAAGVTIQGIASLVLGHQGMPRRDYTYLPEFAGLHRNVSLGALLVGAGLAWTGVYLLHALVRRPPGRA